MENNLLINKESIQRVYEWFISEKFFVNRKYQRKLVWTVEEKMNFIDSISRQYSVPLFLLADNSSSEEVKYEIIDGMQRLDAIFSFIQGEFKLHNETYDGYFDLNTMALTKELLDDGKLTQKKPVLPRSLCTQISNYPLPFSITNFDDVIIEEIFRRINSGGRQLSKQDLRQAGSICLFSETVRKIANKVRRDYSSKDILELSQMRKISLSNHDLDYGIKLEQVFWVKQGIITIKNMRESMDEQMVGQLLAYILLGEQAEPTSYTLDVLYGVYGGELELFKKAEAEITRIGAEKIIDSFMNIMNEFEKIFDLANKTFTNLVFHNEGSAKVRSFQVIYLALYCLYNESKAITDYNKIISKLDGLALRELDNVGDSDWGSQKRHEKILAVKSIIEDAFGNMIKKDISFSNIEKVENILVDSSIEKQMLDLKIGLCNLDRAGEYNKKCLSKIVKTLTAMANTKPREVGYIILGIADREDHANFYQEKFKKDVRQYNGYFITGIEDERKQLGYSLDTYWEKIRKEIENEPISEYAKSYILRNMTPLMYYEKELILFTIKSDGVPQSYDNEFYERNASSVVSLKQGEEQYMAMMKRVFTLSE